jgi:RNA polymerase sigma factor (sigma-70 family)
MQSPWFTTRSQLFAEDDAQVWEAVAAYGPPLTHVLESRYRWLKREDVEDLVQQLLIEVRQTLVEAHDPKRGRFRALLTTVLQRRVVDLVRRKAPTDLGDADVELAAPPEAELDALDLEQSLVYAMSACRDRFTQGSEEDLDVLYAFVDRVVHGKSNVEIAREAGVSVDRVARLLRRARDCVFSELLAQQLDLERGDPALPGLTELFKASLRDPRSVGPDELARLPAPLSEGFADFLARLRTALARFRGREGQGEFRRGLEAVFGSEEPGA